MMRDASILLPTRPQEALPDLLAQAQRSLLQNDPLRALRYAQRAEHLARRSDSRPQWARAQLLWGIGCLQLEQPEIAVLVLTGALATYRFLGDHDGEWYTLRLIARGWELMHDPEQAELTRQAAAFLELSEGAGVSGVWPDLPEP